MQTLDNALAPARAAAATSPTRTTAAKPQSLQASSSSAPALLRDEKGQIDIARELEARFHAMKTYGKEPESLTAITVVFLKDLAEFTTEQVQRAIKTHSQRSQEFPTVADIAGLIRRKGRPPLTEAQFVAISRKAGEDRTPEEWQYLRDYQAERDGGWDDAPDGAKRDATLADNIRLRKEVTDLKAENRRLADLLREARVATGAERPAPSAQDRVARTIAEMRRAGAPEADVEEFARAHGAAA